MGTPLRFLWLPTSRASASVTTQVLSASTTKLGARFRAPKTGTIDRIALSCSALSGTPTLRCGIQTITPGTGFPSGTYVGGSATFTPIVGYNRITIPGASVTVNDQLATVVEYDSGATSATIRSRITNHWIGTITSNFDLAMTAGTWATNSSTPCVLAQYTDNDLAYRGFFINDTAISFQDSSNPDEYGNKFVPDSNCNCIGINAFIRDNGAVNTDFQLRLLDASGATLASVNHVETADTLSSAPMEVNYYWTPVALTKNTTYYVTVKATGTVNGQVYTLPFNYSDIREAMTGSSFRVSRNNGGAFTEDNTQVMLMNPIIQELTSSGSSGVALIGDGGLIY